MNITYRFGGISRVSPLKTIFLLLDGLWRTVNFPNPFSLKKSRPPPDAERACIPNTERRYSPDPSLPFSWLAEYSLNPHSQPFHPYPCFGRH
jgi:hypothetical protein